MGLYEFQSEDAYRFAHSRGIEVKPKGNELHFTYCPYCHGGDRKDKQTFSINLENGQFHCLRSSCGRNGNFITLARDFGFSLGNDMDRYYSDRRQFCQFKVKKIETKDKAVAYLKTRGISEAVTRRYEITVHKEHDNILVFPFFDEKSVLRYIKYRKTDFNRERDGNYKEWAHAVKDGEGRVIKSCMPILFGMKQCNGRFDRIIITEGQIDSLSVAEAGMENAVSVPTGAKGFTWVPYCWDWFSKFKELIVFGDCEHGEITLLKDLMKRFPGTIKAVRTEDYRGCKDANEILVKHGSKAVKEAVEQAEPIPVKRIRELADVQAVDIYSIPKIETGIKSIDRILGGLYSGQVVLLTGKRGDGKSTFMGQVMASALEQGKNVLAYSGELQDYFFKRWLDMQIAGRRNIVVNTREDGSRAIFLTNSIVDRINDWYRGRAFIYDNSIVEEDEAEDLLKTIEKAVMQYGIHMVCIDNLMTALDVGVSEDIYRAQSRFVNRLCLLAKRLEVIILLVVHPRKNKFSADENDEVSGSADITNRVDVVMTYKRDKELLPDERYLTISKNRLTGKTTTGPGILLRYDGISKRIADQVKQFDEAYGWEQLEDGFISLDGAEPSPFT